MSDILIKGMEMPKEGFVEILIRSDGTVVQTGQSKRLNGRDYYVPYKGAIPQLFTAVNVPPHGRLIDADALMRVFEREQKAMYDHGQEFSCSFMSNSQEISTEWYCVEDMLDNAPTIIPTDKEDDNG